MDDDQQAGPSPVPPPRSPGLEVADPTLASLTALVTQVEESVRLLTLVGDRAGAVVRRRLAGDSYSEIVESKERPFIVEVITTAMSGLGEAGGQYRRAQARALRAEGVSVPDIARLFGVTRQRVSALLDDRV
ncbi:helix-turn-helix domain-containing protein [Kineococcus radiotolerans]|uniref:Uncharacterized protein n=1 Tax=Kineococcus radiotolerans (strain ATCC BAA-149 / DSM 14245 / SRS30216) TaxID=266940 RepID=A6W941_KINRD|nr:hypothetical protein [Kineococcus radiotolerans]ABS03330.1 hypothetical protein Krad_1844 [Kineococcus radiotolerans SRS30216 = ATCC BAA-149]